MPEATIHSVPYFSQWESAQLAEEFWQEPAKVLDDPKWKNSGADTPEEYFLWSWSLCGLACLKMALNHWFDIEIPLVSTGKKSLTRNVYRINNQAYQNDDHVKAISPMYYKEFSNFAREEFGLKSRVYKHLKIKTITDQISQENLVIASANSAIRDLTIQPKTKGGHLILVVGFQDQDFFIHNPSGLPGKSQKNFRVSFEQFDKYFAQRGIILERPND